MAITITYSYLGQARSLPYANDKYHDIYEALAKAEGVDLSAFLAMEQQLRALTRDKQALKDYREKEFARLGFADIQVTREP